MGLIENNHRYSYSQLSSFNECPYGYYLSRIEKQPEVDNAFSQYGTLMHSCIERWANGQLKEDDLVAAWQNEYGENVTYAWPKFLAAKGYGQKAYEAGRVYLKQFDGFKGYTILDAQLKCETTIAGKQFVGIVDMIMIDEKTKQLVVVDHKSKSKSAFKKSANEMYKQLYLYCKFIKEQYGKFPDKLRFNLFKERLYDERKFDINEYNKAIAWAQDTIYKIENYEFIDFLEMKKADLFCTAICGVRNSCPNGKTNVNRGPKDD